MANSSSGNGVQSGNGNNCSNEAAVPYTQKSSGSNREYNCFLVCGSVFECPARYLPLKPIGKGAYGVVCSARDLVTNQKVAIKKISNAFDNAVDAKRTLREIKLLRHLNHENIVQIKDIVPPLSRGNFKDVYVVYELMDTDLHQIIRSPQPLSDDHCQYFLYQVLRGLKYIHTAHILHRDLKPSNLLVNANCDLKICDFGLARSTSSQQQEFLTEYVVTRWYRAPELLLSSSEYTAAIDVWSVGCIFAELLGRKPLFPGKDYVHQLNLITQALGSPGDSDLAFIQSEKARRYVRQLPHAQRADFRTIWPHASAKALDLLERMLVFNPSQRISIEDALAHPYLASLHDLSDEPSCSQPWTWDLDSEAITPDLVREMILRDVAVMHPEEAQDWADGSQPTGGTGSVGNAAPAAAAQEHPQQQAAVHQQRTHQPGHHQGQQTQRVMQQQQQQHAQQQREYQQQQPMQHQHIQQQQQYLQHAHSHQPTLPPGHQQMQMHGQQYHAQYQHPHQPQQHTGPVAGPPTHVYQGMHTGAAAGTGLAAAPVVPGVASPARLISS